MSELDWDSPLLGGNSTNEYAERLADDPQWQIVSAFVKNRDGCCQMCKSKENLRAHHLAYCDFYNPEYLITLCDKCHTQVHEITKAYKEFQQSGEYRKVIDYVNEYISTHIIDPFVIERCAELSPDGDIHFFTGSLKERVNLNDFIKKLIFLDPYKYGLQSGKTDSAGYWIRPNGLSTFSRYQDMRLKKEGRK